MVKFRNVTKTYGEITALGEVSFEIDEGEFVFITGPSGAGKTTVIKLLIDEIKPDTGEIEVNGVDLGKLKIRDLPNFRRQIGTVFQDFKLLVDRTVNENIEVALAVHAIPRKEWDARVEQVLKLVGLSNRGNLFPTQLSGGELQRATIARALVGNPKLVLADEPTGNLDWDTASGIMELLEKINQEGKTIIMATHNIEIVDKLRKRVIKLESGRLVKDMKHSKY